MSSSRRARSSAALVVGGWALTVGHDTEPRLAALVDDGGQVVVRPGGEDGEVDRDGRRAGAAEQRHRDVGGAAVRDGQRVTRCREDPLQRR